MRPLRSAAPGDLLLVFADNLSRCWNQIIHFEPSDAGRVVDRSGSRTD